MKPLQFIGKSLVGGLLLATTFSLPAMAQTLVSDSGLTRIHDYPFPERLLNQGDQLSYTTQVGGRTYRGVITVTHIGRGGVLGWFSDRSTDYAYGCSGDVTIIMLGNNRYRATWKVGGSYSPRVTCLDTGQTFEFNLRRAP
ncbi:hypothetical protein L3556_06725 [Candidatus Synechococcus calcipolaris G9]|uniref:Uncharacterized protein n=1 Tax=Candidatus Synechococcus calcipolaris G9 TaxID=1497997 RepID=A0ABT6EXV3_9SYNE|nr:hypothetical protein [Candidatus Synechococcus calcipolaris]MDG2990629.1 hypothetical protein [Candidatus Synechococcus calcipolaris G9]